MDVPKEHSMADQWELQRARRSGDSLGCQMVGQTAVQTAVQLALQTAHHSEHCLAALMAVQMAAQRVLHLASMTDKTRARH